MRSNIKPVNQFKVVYYPAGKAGGLVAGYASDEAHAEEIAMGRAPATIWDQWNREPGRDGKRHYAPVLVKMVNP